MKNYEMKEYGQTPEQKIRAYEIKITGMQAEIELLKLQLLNRDSQLRNREIMSLLDRLIIPETVGDPV